MVDRSTNFSVDNEVTSFVYDETHDVLYFTKLRSVVRWSLANPVQETIYNIGGPLLFALAISPDDSYLLVLPQGVTSLGGDQWRATVTRIQLDDFAFEDIHYTVSGPERGPTDVVVVGSDHGLITPSYAGTGQVPLREFDADAPTPTFSVMLPDEYQSAMLIASEGNRYALILRGNSSGGSMWVYDSLTDKQTPELGFSGFNGWQADINEARGLVAVAKSSQFVTDLNLILVHDFTPALFDKEVQGVRFSPDGNHLFVWSLALDQVLVFDTHSWAQVAALAVPAHDTFTNRSPNMAVIDDGTMLALRYVGHLSSDFHLIDLSFRLSLTRTGTAGADELFGAVGVDTLSGLAGSDVLHGGGGNDTLNGGDGYDWASYTVASSQANWQLNPNGTWTVTAPGHGTDTLSNIEALRFSNGDIYLAGPPPPPASPPPVADYGQSITISNVRGFVYDEINDVFYFSTPQHLYRWSLGDQEFLSPVFVGERLGDLSLTPDGSQILVGQYFVHQGGPTYPITVHRVSLSNFAVEDLTYVSNDFADALGAFDIVVLNDGTALFTTDFGGDGWRPLRTFDALGSGLVPSNVGTVIVPDTSFLLKSEHGRYGLVIETSSNGRVRLYDANVNAATATTDQFELGLTSLQMFSRGHGDVSETRGLVAYSTEYTLLVLDMNLDLVRNMNAVVDPVGSIAGLQFTQSGNHLFLWDAQTGGLVIYDTHSWNVVGNIDIQQDVTGLSTAWGQMDVVNDGRLLMVHVPSGYEIIDLAARMSLNLTGGLAADSLYGTPGVDTLNGGDGADILHGDGSADVINGGAGLDTASYSGAGRGVNVFLANMAASTGDAAGDAFTSIENLTGSAFADQLVGDSGANVLDGGAGNDLLNGGVGADTMIGGLGDDQFVIENAGDVVSEFSNQGRDTVLAPFTYTLALNVEDLALTGAGAMNGFGNNLNNLMVGNAAVNGLDGGGGADFMVGGGGDDLYFFDHMNDVAIESAGEGRDTVYTTISTQLGDGFLEDLVGVGSVGLGLTGNSLANLIVGASGADGIDGLGGADFMVGGLGDDLYYFDHANDVAIESAGEGRDTVYTSVTTQLGDGAIEDLAGLGSIGLGLTGNALNNLIVGTSGADGINGLGGADFMVGGLGDDLYYFDHMNDVAIESAGQGRDTVYTSVSAQLGDGAIEDLAGLGSVGLGLTGNALDNLIVGTSGADGINGLGGADFMVGGLGDDEYIVDNISDIVIESAGEGRDTIYASIHYTLGDGEVEDLALTGVAGINGTGNAQANLIVGNDGANLLEGRAGADTLVGGGGADAFIYATTSHGGDQIFDFTAGVDDIVVSAAGFGGGLTAGGPVTLVSGSDPSSVGAAFLYDTDDGTLYWDVDGTGGTAAVLIATLTTKPNLTAADIIVGA